MVDDDFPILSPIEARVLGCLIEKKEVTPDVYPLTLNALIAAANQKTAREPVMAVETSEVHRALGLLEQKGLSRQVFASRVERYEHTVAQRFSLTTQQIVLVGLLLLRGPQTAYELSARSERMVRFASVDDLRGDLDLLIGRKPPLVQQLDRSPGQREERFVHLLSGKVEDVAPATTMRTAVPTLDLEARIVALEELVAKLGERIEALSNESR